LLRDLNRVELFLFLSRAVINQNPLIAPHLVLIIVALFKVVFSEDERLAGHLVHAALDIFLCCQVIF
jgi:hypothetical protein